MYYETEDGVIFVNNGYVDINGNPVKKTKREYPYSYDPYVVWKKDYVEAKSHTVYSDRLLQWDYKKFEECCMDVWGNHRQGFNGREPEDIERFLSRYFGEKVKLTVIMECCNVSSGYPIWVFYYEKLNNNL
ncbi:hypothetical protein CN384_07975 [Bacillus thuringiensis]|uniref:hypothetical protein n=1 Tax=Bacillus thuringiensis TaxID=1428 RepID=UPI000BF80CCC|nr:hypothetical protein [Bacillus thuringiensis]PFA29615.1 hypothetical protein CN384_07975 [Bacillus thuringiensis]